MVMASRIDKVAILGDFVRFGDYFVDSLDISQATLTVHESILENILELLLNLHIVGHQAVVAVYLEGSMYVYLAGGCVYGSQDRYVQGTERDSISTTNGPLGFREYFEHQSRGSFLLQCLNSARRYLAQLQIGFSIWLYIYQGPFSPLEGTQARDRLCTLLESRLNSPIASSQSTEVTHSYPTGAPSPPAYTLKCQYPLQSQIRAQGNHVQLQRPAPTRIGISANQTTRPFPSRSNFDTTTSSRQTLLAPQRTSTLHAHNLGFQPLHRHWVRAYSLLSRLIFRQKQRI